MRIDPGESPRPVFDTLVNPNRRMAATEVHGVTDDDVRDAPTFPEIAADLANAISGAVVASYNVYFDMPFLQYELTAAGFPGAAPHLCVMYLRPMIGMGSRCCLDDACATHGIQRSASHMASADAIAAAEVLALALTVLPQQQITSFDDLSRRSNYKFTASFDLPPLDMKSGAAPSQTKSRANVGLPPQSIAKPVRSPIAGYWDALGTVLSDLTISDEEITMLAHKRSECDLSPEQVRALHARAFAHVINQFVDDRYLDKEECRKLNRLHECLAKLGWAPGQAA